MTTRELELISIYFVLLPIAAGLFAWRKAWLPGRILLLFLITGFLTDFTRELCRSGNPELAHGLYYTYTIIESSFFFAWSLYFLKISRNIARIILVANFLAWLFIHVDIPAFSFYESGRNDLYVTYYEFIVAALCSYIILKFTQDKPALTRYPAFWFTSGIFCYCTITYFISSFISFDDIKDIWWIHNAAAIISNLLYCYGFLMISKRKRAAPAH